MKTTKPTCSFGQTNGLWMNHFHQSESTTRFWVVRQAIAGVFRLYYGCKAVHRLQKSTIKDVEQLQMQYLPSVVHMKNLTDFSLLSKIPRSNQLC